MKTRLIKNWITSLIGLTLLGFIVFKFMKNLDVITWDRLVIYGVGILIGFLFFRSKDTWLISKAQSVANGLKKKV